MYINCLRLLNVKSLHGDIPEGGGPLSEPARRRLLLQGANGSGKSTILETIATLWKFWGEWIEEGRESFPPMEQLRHPLTQVDLAAMEIVGIPDMQPLWIGIGKRSEWRALRETHPEGRYAGLIHTDNSDWSFELPQDDLLDLRHRSLAGAQTFPNIIYFSPEGRTIRSPKTIHGDLIDTPQFNTIRWPERPRAEIIDTTRFNWTAVYDPAVSLDSMLLTVKALSPERFEECLRLVNLALEHRQKRITGFSRQTGRLVVEGNTASGVSYQHPIEELSSGEKQMLLLVGFVVAFLRPGGIVLLDEPDLHIHIAMITQLLQTLEYVVRERNGQMIVASHSEVVGDYFSRDAEQIELSPWRKRTHE